MRGKGGKDNIVLKASSVTKTFNLNKNPIKRIGNIIKGKRSDYDEKIAALEGISFELYKGDSLAIIGKMVAAKARCYVNLRNTSTNIRRDNNKWKNSCFIRVRKWFQS